MTTLKQLEQLIELGHRRDRLHYDYLRFLLGLAAGVFAVMASLGSGTTGGGRIADMCFRAGLALLPLGILAGSVALSGEASTARRLVDAFDRRTAGLVTDEPVPASAEPPRYAAIAGRFFHALLLLAALCLSGHAALR